MKKNLEEEAKEFSAAFLREGTAVWPRSMLLLFAVIIKIQPLDRVCWLPAKHLVVWAELAKK